jgi:hypothetical protein
MMNKPVIGVAVAVVVIAGGGWYFLSHRKTPPPPEVPAAVVSEAPPDEPPIQHPLPAVTSGSPQPALPPLVDSDMPLLEALGNLAGKQSVMNFVKPEGLVRNMVVTIDNLPRQKVAVDKRPVSPVGGTFVVQGDSAHSSADRAWRAIHRLVQVIDVLLATPQPQGTIDLVRPNVLYTFADPALEARPAGQKLLIRMGPENAAKIKAKLMQLRAALTAAPPPKQ